MSISPRPLSAIRKNVCVHSADVPVSKIGIAYYPVLVDHVSLRPLAHVKEYIDMLRTALTIKGPTLADWDRHDIRYKKVVDTLSNVINAIRQTDDWRSLAPSPTEEIVMCSDASKHMYGYLIYEDGIVCDSAIPPS